MSAFWRMNTICCSLSLDFFMAKALRLPISQTYRVFLTQIGAVSREQGNAIGFAFLTAARSFAE